MIGRRIWIAVGVLLVAQGLLVWYENHTNERFARNERFTIGLPFAPWFEYTDWQNAIEGGGGVKIHLLSTTVGLMLLAGVMLWGA